VSAQDASASIAGTVVDPLDARVAGAAVTLLRDRGGGTTSVFIRGGNSNFNKMLIDGIPANEPVLTLSASTYFVPRRLSTSRH